MGFGKMEAADEDIGVEMGGDIQNAAVGTPADENALSCFFDEQVLLMPEVIGQACAAHDGAHAFAGRGVDNALKFPFRLTYDRYESVYLISDQSH